MLMQIKAKIKTEEGRKLLSNFKALFSVQGLNLVLSLVTLPYILRVLGIDNFGLYAFSLAIVSFFQIIVDYGFNLNGTKFIAQNKSNNNLVLALVSSVFLIRFFLAVLSLISIILLSYFNNNENLDVIILVSTMLVGNIISSTFIFQGYEKMIYISYVTLPIRIISVGLIFVLLKEETDLKLLIVINSFSFIAINIVLLMVARKIFSISFGFPKQRDVYFFLKDSWSIFYSNFLVNIYIASNIIILGILTNNAIVGYYSVAEKIINVMRGIASLVFQVIYPKTCSLAKSNILKAFDFSKKIVIPFAVIFFVIGFLLTIFSHEVIILLTGELNIESTIALSILAFVPVIVILNIPAYQILLATNQRKAYTMILTGCAITNIFLNFILAYVFSYIGTAVSVLLTEIAITALLNIAALQYIKKNHYERL
jgi:polysaccharide transporter, PST family